MSFFCCACVSSGEIGIVEKFGKFQRLASPGLQVICWPFECMAGRLSARVQQLSVRTATKTKDDVTVDVAEVDIVEVTVDVTVDVTVVARVTVALDVAVELTVVEPDDETVLLTVVVALDIIDDVAVVDNEVVTDDVTVVVTEVTTVDV